MWRVWLTETARDALIAASRRAHPRETGGVLVGVLAWGRPWVTHAVEVSSRHSSTSYFELPSGSRNRTIAQLRTKDSRLGYLGDWHSHSCDVDPSTIDRDAMSRLERYGDCPRPLLFVVRRAEKSHQIDPRQWTGASLRRLRIVEAGPLQEPDRSDGFEGRFDR